MEINWPATGETGNRVENFLREIPSVGHKSIVFQRELVSDFQAGKPILNYDLNSVERARTAQSPDDYLSIGLNRHGIKNFRI